MEAVQHRIRRLAPSVQLRETKEIYIITRLTDMANLKIRAGILDLKRLIGRERGLEQWMPAVKAAFPVKSRVLADEIFPVLGVKARGLDKQSYSEAAFLDELIPAQPRLVTVATMKRRIVVRLGRMIAEYTDLSIGKMKARTTAIESVDPGAVYEGIEKFRLTGYRNTSYVVQIKRMIGLKS